MRKSSVSELSKNDYLPTWQVLVDKPMPVKRSIAEPHLGGRRGNSYIRQKTVPGNLPTLSQRDN